MSTLKCLVSYVAIIVILALVVYAITISPIFFWVFFVVAAFLVAELMDRYKKGRNN